MKAEKGSSADAGQQSHWRGRRARTLEYNRWTHPTPLNVLVRVR
jgi:hypothetical protein